MATERTKPKANRSSASNAKPGPQRVSFYVEQLAMGLGTMVPAQRIVLYVRALADVTEEQLAHGFDMALKVFKSEFGQTFPQPAQLREWCFQWRPKTIDDARHILGRGEKPPDWEPLKPGELEAMKKEFQDKLKEAAEKKAM